MKQNLNRRPATFHRGGETERGQAIVEFALSLPLLLLIIAGVAEVGNLLVAYNQVQLLAREGARFAARGRPDSEISDVIFASPDEAGEIDPRYSPDRMSVWIVRPTLNINAGTWSWEGDSSGTTWGDATEKCVYGDICADSGATSEIDPAVVLDEMQDIPDTGDGLSGETFTVVAINYEIQTLLNLPIFTIGENGMVPVRVYTIIRQETAPPIESPGGPGGGGGDTSPQSGCAAFPIAINKNFLSGAIPGDKITVTPRSGTSAPGGFQFIAWNTSYQQLSDLDDALKSSLVSVTDNRWYTNPDDVGDHELVIGKKILRPNEASPDWTEVKNVLATHKDANNILPGAQPRTLLLVVFDPTTFSGSGSAAQVQISDFALFHILSYDPTLNLNTMDLRFMDYYTGCGQP
jgi:hypothetical protein